MEGAIKRNLRGQLEYRISEGQDNDNEYAVTFERNDGYSDESVLGFATREGLYEFGMMLVSQFAPEENEQVASKEALISAVLEDSRFNRAVTGAVRYEVSKRFQVAADAASE